MNGEIAAILAMDGIASGAIYVLIGLGLVLIFAVTRVIFVPFGDIAAFTALSLASLETGTRPGTVGLVAVLAVLALAVEAASLVKNRALHRLPRALLFYLIVPLVPAVAVWFAAGMTLSMPLRIVLSVALVLPIAPLLDRIVFRPIAFGSASAHGRRGPALCLVRIGADVLRP
jgi:branched-chain amino acid transport system permease protein